MTGTIIVSVLLVAIVSGIIVKMIRDKKRGRTSCSCGCGGCSMAGSCHKKK